MTDQEAGAARALVEQWREYVQHRPKCRIYVCRVCGHNKGEHQIVQASSRNRHEWNAAECTCGLSALLAQAGGPPQQTRCTLCLDDYPPTGQQTGPIWGVWGPGYRICKRCVGAARHAKSRNHNTTP